MKDFQKFNNQTSNHYQLEKIKDFFEFVKTNFILESFTNSHYRMLITIPELNVYKEKSWKVDIWIADELFHYLHPFLFYGIFDKKLNTYQLQVLAEIIKIHSSPDLRKEFYIQEFIDHYPASLSYQQKNKIRKYFIHYLQLFEQQGKIQNKVLNLSSNQIFDIQELNYSHSTIAVFEIVDVRFIT